MTFVLETLSSDIFFHPCRVSVADGAHLTEFATELPHFEGLHLKNTNLFGEDTRVIISAAREFLCYFVGDFPRLFCAVTF